MPSATTRWMGPGRDVGGERLITMGHDQGNPIEYIVVCEWLPTGRGSSRDLAEAFNCKVLWAGTCLDVEVWKRLAELMSEWQVLFDVSDADPELNLAGHFAGSLKATRRPAGIGRSRTPREIVGVGRRTREPRC